jgi:hypothetical protein
VGYQLELYEEAEQAYQEALGHSRSVGRNDPSLLLGLGMCQRMRGNLVAARNTVREALDAASTDPLAREDDGFLAEAWRTLGEVEHELARHEEAIDALETSCGSTGIRLSPTRFERPSTASGTSLSRWGTPGAVCNTILRSSCNWKRRP